jgi:hypothetical protein
LSPVTGTGWVAAGVGALGAGIKVRSGGSFWAAASAATKLAPPRTRPIATRHIRSLKRFIIFK